MALGVWAVRWHEWRLVGKVMITYDLEWFTDPWRGVRARVLLQSSFENLQRSSSVAAIHSWYRVFNVDERNLVLFEKA